MYSALSLPPATKLTLRTSTDVRVGITTTGHLSITDKISKRRFQVDISSDVCVYSRRLVPLRKERVN
jgi:hypothetical protein